MPVVTCELWYITDGENNTQIDCVLLVSEWVSERVEFNVPPDTV